MASGFLGALADQINNQFSVGENTNNSLDAVIDGQYQKYGALGDFASKFDQSSERRYVEEGYLRKDPYNTDPKQFEILMQEPSATVLFKKRMFSSVNENFRPDYMDADEKIYYKAMKCLFQNKCRQISALEKLSKIQKITSEMGNVPNQLMPIIFTLGDTVRDGFDTGSSVFGASTSFGGSGPGKAGGFLSILDRLRKVYGFNVTNNSTTWITDTTNLFQSQYGQGTGVIEITNFTNLTTTTTLDLKTPGTFSLKIVDPYEATLITEYDIEKALSDATNSYYNHKIFQFSQQGAEQIINDTTVRLNSLRSLRKASPISFNINPDTLLGKRVVAIIDRIGTELIFEYASTFDGGSVKVAAAYLKGGEVAGFDGLDTGAKNNLGPDKNIKAENAESELSVFKRLVSAIFSKLTLEANSKGAFVSNNKLTNYARRKLRSTFSGQSIIQPMDTVHIYANTKSRYDNKLLSGLNNMFTGANILQNVNNTVTNLKNSFDTLFNPAGSVNLQAEKIAFVGSDFPNLLWSLIRNQFISEKEGTHIFGGIVQGVQDSWSDGKFILDVKGEDNTAYFSMGKINFKPAADVFNGSFFDPLTPFKSKFDLIGSDGKRDSLGLLHENKLLLGSISDTDSPLVKYKLGPNAGEAVYQENFSQDITIDKATRSLNKIFYAPDGLVYKWKEGIGVLTQFGSSTELNDPNKVGNFSITNEPFAGQDVMNVISLLITGQPYNFATYWKAVINIDGSNRDPISQKDAAYSFQDSLKNDLKKNNSIWGNFIPFKNLSMDEQSVAKAMDTQTRIININRDLDTKLQELSEVKSIVSIFGGANDLQANNSESKSRQDKAEVRAKVLQNEITGLLNAIQTDDKTKNSLITSGNDVSLNINEFINKGVGDDPASRRLLRRQINYLTRRMSYNVRANQDKNLFIVDDSYDKDYDILAYETAFSGGQKLFNSEFLSVKDKIDVTANLLNLEVFCDTQGHIRVRSPQYNRMPSSIFYKMMNLKKTSGIQIFPQFLDDLFGDQIKSLTERVEVVEDQIRLYCAAIGVTVESDNDLADQETALFINSYSGISNEGFRFISSSEGIITDLNIVKDEANPENKVIDRDSPSFTNLGKQATSTKNIFDNKVRVKIILESLEENNLDQIGYGIKDVASFSMNTRVDDLVNRLQIKTGQQVDKNSFIDTSNKNNPIIDIFKVTKELHEKIGLRQQAIKLLYGSLKNAMEARSLDDDSSTGSRLLTPGAYGNSHTPEIFEHMIEDESYDDYGPGSGSRYIIKRAQIKSINISVNPPDLTMVSVQGRIDPLVPNSTLPAELNAFQRDGNSLVTAQAIDYDTWRNYGFREQSPINAPFLKDPITQCAPFASMILSRARKNILRGTVTIAFNEYMQPGEVIFLEDRGMLFYVTSVNHNFTYGSSSTTTLNLYYGHTPGDYIPTTLDVIGKLIYRNRDLSDIIIQRQSTSFNESGVGVLIKDRKSPAVLNTGGKDDYVNEYSSSNTATINNILYTTFEKINSNKSKGNNVKASIELRIYHDKKHSPNKDLQEFANRIQQILTMPGQIPAQAANKSSGSPANPTLKDKDVKVVIIDMSDEKINKSPSQQAIDAARNSTATISTNPIDNIIGAAKNILSTDTTSNVDKKDKQEKDKLRLSLFSYIVDCWIKLENVPAPTDIISTSIATRK